MSWKNALCNSEQVRRTIDAFIRGDDAAEHSVKAAVALCAQCPVIEACAEQALTSGNVLDGSVTSPASGVVQAGVVCHGDQETAEHLAALAGMDVPTYRFQKPRRRAPDRCVHCDRRMVSWSRSGAPRGRVMHHSRGFCVRCRGAYQRALEAAPVSRGLRKDTVA